MTEWTARVEADLSGTHPIENVADLMAYDRLRALQVLSGGRDIRIVMEDPQFRDGKFVVTNTQVVFDVSFALEQPGEPRIVYREPNDFFRPTTSNVTCVFEQSSVGNMTDGMQYVVRAKLIEC